MDDEVSCFNASPYWDVDLWWNSTTPQLSECLKSTVLVWLPCGVTWLLLPLKIYSLRRSKSRLLPWTLLNISKLVLGVLLCLLFIIKLSLELSLSHQLTTRLILGSSFQVLTFVLLSVVIYLDLKYGVQSSVYLLCQWLVFSLAGLLIAVHYAHSYTLPLSRRGAAEFVLFCIYYPLLLSQLVLSILTDAKPIYSIHNRLNNKNVSPYESASFLSRLVFAWYDRLLWRGFRKELKSEDIWQAISQVQTQHSVIKCTSIIAKEALTNKTISFGWVIFKAFWPQMLFVVFLFIMADLCVYAIPLILKEFLRFLSSDEPNWHGVVFIISMFLAQITDFIFTWQAIFYSQIICCSIRTSFTSLIYRKCLSLSSCYKQKTTTGEMINLMAVDVFRVVEFIDDILYSIIFPMQVSICFYMLYQLVNLATLAAFGAMVLIKIFSAFLANKQETLERKQLKLKDERIKNLSEAISGVKVLKFFAWENSFMARICQIREKETLTIRGCLIIEGIVNLIWGLAPILMNVAIFGTYILMDRNNVLDVEKIFITISVIGILQMPMFRLPMVIAGFIQARVSIVRINDYLNGLDINEQDIQRSYNKNGKTAVSVTNGSFSWQHDGLSSEALNLEGINVCVREGQLVAVVGSVGSGKSSLLSALLGEMNIKSGSVQINGKIAYVSQQAWIQNATLKDNILFGKEFQEERYKSVIECCDLEPDLAIMPGGDEAEIGEKGINLSGGQKQRISLARAVYDDADLYLLDDPLSAVDPHVGSHLFNKVIGCQGLLKNKTRILVTHSLTFLPSVDYILVLANGKITEMGTYEELIESNNGFAQFLKTYRTEDQATPQFNRSESVKSDTLSIDSQLDDGQLIAEEFRQHGKVKSSVYWSYLSSMGAPLIALSITFAVIAFAFSAADQIWLAEWSEDQYLNLSSDAMRDQNFMRLGMYCVFVVCNSIFLGLFIVTVVYGAMKACVSFHKKLLYSVLRSPMSFFDTTPSGRIVNRFAKDIEMVDGSLPSSFENILVAIMQILEALVVICIQIPIFIAVSVPLFGLYYLIQVFFIRTLDQLRRLESVSRSPIYSRFSETLAGVSTLRAFRKENEFIQAFDRLVNDNMKYVFNIKVVFTWVGVRLDSMGNCFILLASIFGLMQRDILSAGTIALIINYSVSICMTFMWLVENAGNLESNIVSVERLNEYIGLEPEAEWQKDVDVDGDWPSKGEISFNNYSTKYRPELPPVLKKVSFKVEAGEKVGVVGRTGAGKSSVALSLFRMMEAAEGNICIDGLDISTLGLHQLRSKLTIIPQDPVLFSGPLRLNLDPYSRFTDEDLWKALELAHLKDFIVASGSNLNQDISEGGSNLSVGQKQLVCLARALLEKTKVLVLDEATAAVDSETDALIQSTIRKEFSHCTILTIAHRLNTIMDCSRLLVLSEGKVKAFDSPNKLLNIIQTDA